MSSRSFCTVAWIGSMVSVTMLMTACSGMVESLKNRGNTHKEVIPEGATSDTIPNLEPMIKRKYNGNSRTTREDFVDHSPDEGSLWASRGQTNYYFTKNKIRNPGDIVTLILDNDLYREIGMEVRQNLSPREKFIEVEKVREEYLAKRPLSERMPLTAPTATSAGFAAPTPSASPSEKSGFSPVVELPEAKSRDDQQRIASEINLSNVDIYSALQMKSDDRMMGEVIERYPNGNYKIRATKRIAYDKGAPRVVSVTGVIKASDIDEDTDTINAGKLYEYRTEVSH